MKPSHRWLAICFAAALAWGIFLATNGKMIGIGELQAPGLEASPILRSTDFRWNLVDLDDQPVDFLRFKGRPILLNHWASWCPPCNAEMPSIDRLAANPRLKDMGVVFLCVTTEESGPKLKAFLKDKTWKMTFLRATNIPPVFFTEGIPATYLIAPDGRIAAAEVGAARWDDPSVIDFIEKMAKPVR